MRSAMIGRAPTILHRMHLAMLICLCLACAQPARAAEWVVAQVAPLSGVLATTGERMVLGVKLHFDAVNAAGGIHGRPIRHVVRDDGYRVDDTIALTRELLEGVKPIALIGYAGTANVTALLGSGLFEKHRTVMVGPYTGGESLRTPYNPYIFHVRASYEDETEHMVKQLTQLGSRRIAVLYQDDGFGRSGLVGVEAALKRRGLEPVATAAYDRVTADVSPAVEVLAAAEPSAIIMIAINRATAEFARQYRGRDGRAQLFNISVVNPQELVRLAGIEGVHGLGISQVVPYPYKGLLPVVREYHAALARFAPPGTEPSYTCFETFLAAKVLTEALRRLGPNAAPRDVEAALEGLGRFDLGGFELEYGPNRRSGSSFVDITVIGRTGQLMR
ncbi:MAG: ABC transporter substrate-binding protein [Rhodocyclaceae bacterium]|nr:ABC transporter substrate-binding protein [Rhodocyclaceae bacterium]MCL4759461.1 ABC transporter substrate-binding protein [Rhodocyclaceae bacterium]